MAYVEEILVTGIKMPSYLNDPLAPRGIKNNNPGNLVKTNIAWKGKIPLSENRDSRFEQFTDILWGTRALILDLYNDYKRGLTTVSQLISEFAPSSENNTNAYINFVANRMGVAPNVPFEMNPTNLFNLTKAIIVYENGTQALGYVTDQLIEAARNLVLDSKKKR